MKRILLLILACTLLLCFSAAEAEDAAALHVGQFRAEVEAIWGSPISVPGYSSIRCYQKDGHTLICGYGPCDAEYRTFGLVEWVEFSGLRRVGDQPGSELRSRSSVGTNDDFHIETS